MEVFGIQITIGKILLLLVILYWLWGLIMRKKKPTPKWSSFDEWLLDAVKFFRGLGFFERDRNLSDGSLTNKFGEKLRKEIGLENIDINDSNSDLFLLQFDKDRVWFDELEADVARGNNAYEEVIKKWVKLSQGNLKISNIVEDWLSETGPIKLRFDLNEVTYEVKIKYQNDYLDPVDILEKMNQALKRTGYKYALGSVDQLGYVVYIKEADAKRIRVERDLIFI